jgi:antitoxin VapB
MTMTKVFKSGNSQAVRIPKEFQLDVEDVEILQQGNDLIIRKPHRDASALLKVFQGFSEDFFKDGREQPPMQERETLR